MKVAIVIEFDFYLPEDVEEKLKSKGYTEQEIYKNDKFRANKDLIEALYEHGIDNDGHLISDVANIGIVDIPDSTTDFATQADTSDFGGGFETLWYVVDGKLYSTYWDPDNFKEV